MHHAPIPAIVLPVKWGTGLGGVEAEKRGLEATDLKITVPLKKKRRERTMTANKFIRGPLWATLVGALVVAIMVVGATFFVFVQTGEAAPQVADKQPPPYASVSPKIVGGTQVPNGKYPFMAHIEIRMLIGGATCEGTLIDPDSVLTVAHCARRLENSVGARVVVGVTDLRQRDQGQAIGASRAFIHPRFDPTRSHSYAYDAGALKLRRAVTGIKPIKLATAKQNYLETPGRKLTVAGWGLTREKRNPKPGDLVPRMREVSVPVVSDSRARQAYASLPPSEFARYFPSLMVAAGEKGKDACQGDSGGPLFDSGSRTQVGITSSGLGCGRAGYPGIYTEVNNPKIRNWIVSAAKR
jgi:secreted trypsin-like serine protease